MLVKLTGLITVFIVIFAGPLPGTGETIDAGYRAWRKEVALREPLLVGKDGTLYVAPGTRIRVEIQGKPAGEDALQALSIRGRLIIDGTEKMPVLITGKKGWGEIFMEDAEVVVRHARVENATWAFHIHGGFTLIEKSDISQNEGGIRTYRSGMYIRESTLAGNKVAIRYWEGGPIVRSTSIVGNGVGVFFREGNSSALFRNNLIDNREYNLKIGDFASGLPDLRENFWGSRDERVIRGKIFDGRENTITVQDIRPILEIPPPDFYENYKRQ
jgi:hypothetical protein